MYILAQSAHSEVLESSLKTSNPNVFSSLSVLQSWLAYTPDMDVSPVRAVSAALSFRTQTSSPGWPLTWAAPWSTTLLRPCQASAPWLAHLRDLLMRTRASSLQLLPMYLQRPARKALSSWMSSKFMGATLERSLWVTQMRLCLPAARITLVALHQPLLLRLLGSRVSTCLTGIRLLGHTPLVKDTGWLRTPQGHTRHLSSCLAQVLWRTCLIWARHFCENRTPLAQVNLILLQCRFPLWRWSRPFVSTAPNSGMEACHPSWKVEVRAAALFAETMPPVSTMGFAPARDARAFSR